MKRSWLAIPALMAITLPFGAQADKERTPEVTVALLGDTGAGAGFESVLRLIRAEAPNVVMVNGDFGYGSDPAAWAARVRDNLDLDKTAVIGALGNHDVERDGLAEQYVSIFQSFRRPTNGLNEQCTGSKEIRTGRDVVAVDEICTFGNLSVVASAIGQLFTKDYFEDQLEKKLNSVPDGNWKLAGYHFTLASMNPGLKSDQSTHRFFDLIRRHGAIGAQAHTHSAMASCPIVSEFRRGVEVQCHRDFGDDLEYRFVGRGTGLYVDSSLGGMGPRERKRCHGADDRCRHMVDLISKEGYTRVDGQRKRFNSRHGALFLTFNAGGNPGIARAEFKDVNGNTVFRFRITKK